MATRSANLYISPQLYRWLGWLAEMRSQDGESQTADSIAEDILRRAITANIPNIEEVEGEYWNGRQKLDKEAVAKMNANGAASRHTHEQRFQTE